MSNVVNAAGRRGPGHFRAALSLGLGSALLAGCSASSDRFSSSSFGSGYEVRRTSAAAAQPKPQAQAAVSYSSDPPAGPQLASAAPEQASGYIQVSRVDLPPVQQPIQGYQGTRTADGYGRYNPAPATDGAYSGPRVYTPYDKPGDDAPPPPQDYRPGNEEAPPRFDRDSPPPFYRRRSDSDAPPYDPRGEARIYEPKRERDYRDEPSYRDGRQGYSREYDRPVERGAYSPAPGGDGRTVTVAPGETLYLIARRHGVTVDMIVRANGLSSIYVRPGTTLLIPRAGPVAYGQAPAPAPKTQVAACPGERCHLVKPGETLASIARNYGVPEQRLAEANQLSGSRPLKAGQSIAIPADQPQRRAVASLPQKAEGDRLPQGDKPLAPAPAVPAEKSARMGTLQDPQPMLPAPGAKPAAIQPTQDPTCEAQLANPLPRMGNTFRKPVEGKTIAQFGPQRDGTVNEGVTISVPKGTPIKAAENGIVAYVGDELPGFGNLILIRHADEYVTAYAHADKILVTKCAVVKRGQDIATAGATGDASQPQLHFEIRKNSKPVDPAPLLGS